MNSLLKKTEKTKKNPDSLYSGWQINSRWNWCWSTTGLPLWLVLLPSSQPSIPNNYARIGWLWISWFIQCECIKQCSLYLVRLVWKPAWWERVVTCKIFRALNSGSIIDLHNICLFINCSHYLVNCILKVI